MEQNFKELYPENGSVVIIDDAIEEALPLMKVLSRYGIAYKYFNGRKDELPEQLIDNVRIIFLDIQLEGMDGVLNDKTKYSTLKGVVSRIIGEKSIPYAIIVWTKHDELISELNDYLPVKPLFILNMEKEKCKNVSGEFNLYKISDKIKEKTDELGAYKFFMVWQNLINRSSNQIVNEISSIFPYDNNWNNKINNILKLLAEAYAGKQIKNDIGKYSMLTFNNLLLDIVEKNILSGYLSEQNKFSPLMNNDERLEDKIKGELNRRLLISFENNNSPVPGNIYYELPELNLSKEVLIQELFNGKIQDSDVKEKIEKFKLVFLEVSPFCDYAQNKWKRCRLLPGLLCPENYKNNIKRADYIYKTPLFMLDDQLVYLVFDLRHLTSVAVKDMNDKKAYLRVRKELLSDIQTKISNHISRLGVTYV